jgi:tRNA(Arg) A34 adenosine deaminase TadA
MARAIQLARLAMDTPGAKPFAAVVVMDGVIVGEGINRAAGKMDPTSHGEVEAIRDACANLGTLALEGCILYTSCEPCSLCMAAAKIAGIAEIYYGVSLERAGSILCDLMPDLVARNVQLREEVGRPIEQRSTPTRQLMAEKAEAVLEDWSSRLDQE